jgi:peptidoglycan hydrolase CwlO-like protein
LVARARQIAGIAQQVQRIDELDVALAEQEKALAQLHVAKQQRLAQLQSSRAQRKSALGNLQVQARSRRASLTRLRTQRPILEHPVAELARRAAERTDRRPQRFRSSARPAQWPVAGRIVASSVKRAPARGLTA